MIMLLLHFETHKSFTLFCNLIVRRKFLYKTYLFKINYIKDINCCLEHIISKNYFKLYSYLKEKSLDLWNILWVEWVYALFLRTFDVKTCETLWDLILVRGDIFVFKLTYVIFGIIDSNFDELDQN